MKVVVFFLAAFVAVALGMPKITDVGSDALASATAIAKAGPPLGHGPHSLGHGPAIVPLKGLGPRGPPPKEESSEEDFDFDHVPDNFGHKPSGFIPKGIFPGMDTITDLVTGKGLGPSLKGLDVSKLTNMNGLNTFQSNKIIQCFTALLVQALKQLVEQYPHIKKIPGFEAFMASMTAASVSPCGR